MVLTRCCATDDVVNSELMVLTRSCATDDVVNSGLMVLTRSCATDDVEQWTNGVNKIITDDVVNNE